MSQVPGLTTSLLCLFNKECSHHLPPPPPTSSLSELLMEIKKVSVFLLEVYLQSLPDQRGAVYIVSLEQTTGALLIFQSCRTDQSDLLYSPAESCCSLVLSQLSVLSY